MGEPQDQNLVTAIPTPSVQEFALAWLAEDPVCRLLIKENLRVLWSNEAARQFFALETDLELRDGLLVTRNRSHQNGLNLFMAGVGEKLQTHCIPCEDRDGHVLLRGRQISTPNGIRFVGIAFHRSGRNFVARYADLREAFQLTLSEHRVVRQMLDGLTADEISLAQGLSIETVRSHIRNIYTKVGVRSRERLFARLHAYQV